MTYARVDYKAERGYYKGYTIDTDIVGTDYNEIANELMNKDVYKVDIFVGGAEESNIVFTKYNSDF